MLQAGYQVALESKLFSDRRYYYNKDSGYGYYYPQSAKMNAGGGFMANPSVGVIYYTKYAFASALAKQGFRSGGTDSRYVLQVGVDFSSVEFPNQQNKFTRYTIDANLIDTRDASVLLPFNINGREGHISLSEAENRAVAAAEKKINDTYGTVLSDYLVRLLPNTK